MLKGIGDLARRLRERVTKKRSRGRYNKKLIEESISAIKRKIDGKTEVCGPIGSGPT